MLGIIFCLLTILGCYYWQKKKLTNFLTVVFLLLTNFINLDIQESPIKSQDFFFFLMLYCILSSNKSLSTLFSVRGDGVGVFVRYVFFFLSLSFVITVLLGIESFSYALKVYRTFGYFLFYFILREIPKSEFSKSLRKIIYISMIWGVLFALQLCGIDLLKGSVEIDTASGSLSRMRNIPMTTVMTITVIVLSDINSKIKIGLILFWSGILVLSQHRGVMLSLLVAIPLLMIIRREFKKIMLLSIAFGIVLVAFSPMIASRFSAEANDSGMSTLEEIKYGLTMDSKSNYEKGSGTFLFRLFLIRERVEYMSKNPFRLLLGNGMMHEDSPATQRKFNFQLGTYKYGSGSAVMQQISTSDVGLLTFFNRFGLIFIILLICMSIRLFCHFIKNRNFGADVGFVLLTYCYLRVLSGEEFTMLMFLQIFCCYIYSIQNSKCLYNVK